MIVGDLGERFGYDVLNRAFRELLAGAELVALQKNRYWLREDGLCLDVGPLRGGARVRRGVRGSRGRQAGRRRSSAMCWSERAPTPDQAVMVGDDIESDIGGALGAGLAGVLVRTGKYRSDAVLASGIEPTATVDSIADVPDLLLSSNPRAQSVTAPDGAQHPSP